MDKAKLLKQFSQLLDEIEFTEQHAETFYEFETTSVKLLNEMSRDVIEDSIGKSGKDYRKKKRIIGYYGSLELDNRHRFIGEIKGVKLSPMLKDITAYVGQSECYQSSSEILKKTLRLDLSDNSIHRVCQALGKESEKWLEEERQDQQNKPELEPEEILYVHADGGMVLTRPNDWKEVKVGRVYKGKAVHKLSSTRSFIKESWYCYHLGDHEEFEIKMSEYLDDYDHLKDRMVIIIDGAKWMGDWFNAEYPTAQQILDYYHAIEHFSVFAKKVIHKKASRVDWLNQVKSTLLEKGGEHSISLVEKIECKTEKKKEEKAKLMTYLNNNIYRMDYPKYRAKGLQIGSGAMEAAHRTLVQKRCKLSGQRWTPPGVTNIIGLRNLRMNNKWDKLTKFLGKVA
jgi:hypothetical protein